MPGEIKKRFKFRPLMEREADKLVYSFRDTLDTNSFSEQLKKRIFDSYIREHEQINTSKQNLKELRKRFEQSIHQHTPTRNARKQLEHTLRQALVHSGATAEGVVDQFLGKADYGEFPEGLLPELGKSDRRKLEDKFSEYLRVIGEENHKAAGLLERFRRAEEEHSQLLERESRFAEQHINEFSGLITEHARQKLAEYVRDTVKKAYLRSHYLPPHGFGTAVIRQGYVKDAILALAEAKAESVGGPTLTRDDFGRAKLTSLIREYGSLGGVVKENAVGLLLKEAGLEQRLKSAKISEEELMEVVKRLNEVKGSHATYSSALRAVAAEKGISYKTLHALLNPKYPYFAASSERIKPLVHSLREHYRLSPPVDGQRIKPKTHADKAILFMEPGKSHSIKEIYNELKGHYPEITRAYLGAILAMEANSSKPLVERAGERAHFRLTPRGEARKRQLIHPNDELAASGMGLADELGISLEEKPATLLSPENVLEYLAHKVVKEGGWEGGLPIGEMRLWFDSSEGEIHSVLGSLNDDQKQRLAKVMRANSIIRQQEHASAEGAPVLEAQPAAGAAKAEKPQRGEAPPGKTITISKKTWDDAQQAISDGSAAILTLVNRNRMEQLLHFPEIRRIAKEAEGELREKLAEKGVYDYIRKHERSLAGKKVIVKVGSRSVSEEVLPPYGYEKGPILEGEKAARSLLAKYSIEESEENIRKARKLIAYGLGKYADSMLLSHSPETIKEHYDEIQRIDSLLGDLKGRVGRGEDVSGHEIIRALEGLSDPTGTAKRIARSHRLMNYISSHALVSNPWTLLHNIGEMIENGMEGYITRNTISHPPETLKRNLGDIRKSEKVSKFAGVKALCTLPIETIEGRYDKYVKAGLGEKYLGTLLTKSPRKKDKTGVLDRLDRIHEIADEMKEDPELAPYALDRFIDGATLGTAPDQLLATVKKILKISKEMEGDPRLKDYALKKYIDARTILYTNPKVLRDRLIWMLDNGMGRWVSAGTLTRRPEALKENLKKLRTGLGKLLPGWDIDSLLVARTLMADPSTIISNVKRLLSYDIEPNTYNTVYSERRVDAMLKKLIGRPLMLYRELYLIEEANIPSGQKLKHLARLERMMKVYPELTAELARELKSPTRTRYTKRIYRQLKKASKEARKWAYGMFPNYLRSKRAELERAKFEPEHPELVPRDFGPWTEEEARKIAQEVINGKRDKFPGEILADRRLLPIIAREGIEELLRRGLSIPQMRIRQFKELGYTSVLASYPHFTDMFADAGYDASGKRGRWTVEEVTGKRLDKLSGDELEQIVQEMVSGKRRVVGALFESKEARKFAFAEMKRQLKRDGLSIYDFTMDTLLKYHLGAIRQYVSITKWFHENGVEMRVINKGGSAEFLVGGRWLSRTSLRTKTDTDRKLDMVLAKAEELLGDPSYVVHSRRALLAEANSRLGEGDRLKLNALLACFNRSANYKSLTVDQKERVDRIIEKAKARIKAGSAEEVAEEIIRQAIGGKGKLPQNFFKAKAHRAVAFRVALGRLRERGMDESQLTRANVSKMGLGSIFQYVPIDEWFRENGYMVLGFSNKGWDLIGPGGKKVLRPGQYTKWGFFEEMKKFYEEHKEAGSYIGIYDLQRGGSPLPTYFYNHKESLGVKSWPQLQQEFYAWLNTNDGKEAVREFDRQEEERAREKYEEWAKRGAPAEMLPAESATISKKTLKDAQRAIRKRSPEILTLVNRNRMEQLLHFPEIRRIAKEAEGELRRELTKRGAYDYISDYERKFAGKRVVVKVGEKVVFEEVLPKAAEEKPKATIGQLRAKAPPEILEAAEGEARSYVAKGVPDDAIMRRLQEVLSVGSKLTGEEALRLAKAIIARAKEGHAAERKPKGRGMAAEERAADVHSQIDQHLHRMGEMLESGMTWQGKLPARELAEESGVTSRAIRHRFKKASPEQLARLDELNERNRQLKGQARGKPKKRGMAAEERAAKIRSKIDQYLDYMEELLDQGERWIKTIPQSKLSEKFGVSASTIYEHLKSMSPEQKARLDGINRRKAELPHPKVEEYLRYMKWLVDNGKPWMGRIPWAKLSEKFGVAVPTIQSNLNKASSGQIERIEELNRRKELLPRPEISKRAESMVAKARKEVDGYLARLEEVVESGEGWVGDTLPATLLAKGEGVTPQTVRNHFKKASPEQRNRFEELNEMNRQLHKEVFDRYLDYMEELIRLGKPWSGEVPFTDLEKKFGHSPSVVLRRIENATPEQKKRLNEIVNRKEEAFVVRVDRYLDYIEKLLAEGKTWAHSYPVDALVEKFGVSPVTLRRHLKHATSEQLARLDELNERNRQLKRQAGKKPAKGGPVGGLPAAPAAPPEKGNTAYVSQKVWDRAQKVIRDKDLFYISIIRREAWEPLMLFPEIRELVKALPDGEMRSKLSGKGIYSYIAELEAGFGGKEPEIRVEGAAPVKAEKPKPAKVEKQKPAKEKPQLPKQKPVREKQQPRLDKLNAMKMGLPHPIVERYLNHIEGMLERGETWSGRIPYGALTDEFGVVASTIYTNLEKATSEQLARLDELNERNRQLKGQARGKPARKKQQPPKKKHGVAAALGGAIEGKPAGGQKPKEELPDYIPNYKLREIRLKLDKYLDYLERVQYNGKTWRKEILFYSLGLKFGEDKEKVKADFEYATPKQRKRLKRLNKKNSELRKKRKKKKKAPKPPKELRPVTQEDIEAFASALRQAMGMMDRGKAMELLREAIRPITQTGWMMPDESRAVAEALGLGKEGSEKVSEIASDLLLGNKSAIDKIRRLFAPAETPAKEETGPAEAPAEEEAGPSGGGQPVRKPRGREKKPKVPIEELMAKVPPRLLKLADIDAYNFITAESASELIYNVVMRYISHVSGLSEDEKDRVVQEIIRIAQEEHKH